MTLDDLINEGKSFDLKYTSAHLEPAGYGKLKSVPAQYYISNGDKFITWIQKCRRFLIQNYPKDIAIDVFNDTEIENITQSKFLSLTGALEALKAIPELCEIKTIESNPIQTININQTQSINVDIILHALKEEIGKRGLQSIKDVDIKSEEKIKDSVISKLKEFGEDTLSNILANIITNPSIWSQF